MINARIGVALHPFYRRQLSTAFGLKRVWFDEHGEQQTVPADPDARARGRVVARQRHYDEIVRLSESGVEPGCCAIKDARSVIDEHAGRRSSSGTYGSGAMAIPILLDCDPGHDDAVALLLAAADDAVDLAAVTTVAGNCPLDLATLNARRVAALAGLEGVPIAAGAAGPLHGELVTAPDIHGLTGLDGYDLRTGEAPLDPRRALELMSATLEDAPEPVTLVPTGPLTNVAQLLSTRPDLHGRIREIVLMGGSTGRGNTTPAAEFNIFVDPEAAAIVFGSGLPLTMIGLNLTHQARATTDVLARVRALPGEPARAVEGWMSFFGGRYERVHGEFAPPVHDPCTVAMLIDPSLIRCVDTFVAVETEGRWTRGATVVDLNGRLGQPPNARVAMELDAPRFWDLVIGALGRLGGAGY